ncbi:MAG: hypothetical protein GF398_00920 [Chitinivibrionales bacterium]|nr:hypothetical protein [Chitinivibrionales bacterium]
MAHTFEELKGKSVDELREIAKDIEHEAVQGYTQLNKEHLLEAICKALDMDMHEHHEVVGIDKTAAKAKISELKKARQEALESNDAKKLKITRRRIHRLKRKIRNAMV